MHYQILGIQVEVYCTNPNKSQANVCMFRVNNRNTRQTGEICSKLRPQNDVNDFDIYFDFDTNDIVNFDYVFVGWVYWEI